MGTVPLYNVQDDPRGKQGGPYYDDVMAMKQEEQNAAREGRAPKTSASYLKTVSHPGRVLVTGEALLAAHREAGAITTSEIKAPEMSSIEDPADVSERVQKEKAAVTAKRAKNSAESEQFVFEGL